MAAMALLTIACAAQAQRRFDAAVFAGANFNQLDGDDDGGFNHIGLRAGVGTSFSLTTAADSPLRLGVELAFSQKGSTISSSFERRATLSYVEIPVMLSLSLFDSRLRLSAGVAPALLVKASVIQGGSHNTAQERNYLRFDRLPLVLTARYLFTDHWALEARWQNSFLTVCEQSASGTYRIFRDNKGVFPRTVTLGIAYNLFNR